MSSKAGVDTATRFDGAKWLLVAAIVGAGVYGNYYFSEESLLYRVIALLVLAIAAAFVSLQTTKGQAFWSLLNEARAEIRKVVWPSRQETVQTTLIVVAVVFVMSFVLWGIDSLLGWITSSLIG